MGNGEKGIMKREKGLGIWGMGDGERVKRRMGEGGEKMGREIIK
jgi:hypothetical protein